MHKIVIVSGEGEQGTKETYRGRHTVRAVWRRLTVERCDGDRWAHAVVDDVMRCDTVEELELALGGPCQAA